MWCLRLGIINGHLFLFKYWYNIESEKGGFDVIFISMAAGMNDYISKPLDVDTLGVVLNKILIKKQESKNE